MKQKDLKKGVVYIYNGISDGANILFSVKEDGSFDYHTDGAVVLHWSEVTHRKGNGYRTNETSLKTVNIASPKATKFYRKCVKAGKDVGGFTWHDSNK